ncbi:PepSY domain-containing protein [Actinoplanes sp. LDG1-06]|uniref:PepSY domain-containing protein n=1 Tax=Paractinoplanes ovalisporus TaxID=2810368 RepID=A0ABS2A506_9ACTN|nr:PepSY domain-containing protein [Actinoplanes ovalisporus]MBM2614924.1 PepSY domain-containing protein [Actinoplanes ovalisporus]
MNITKLRSKRVIVTTAALAALAVGGGVWATAANADSEVKGGDRDRVGNAAVQAVGGGTVLDVETSDDPGEAYEVEVRKTDGSEVDVALDKDLKVVKQQADTPDAPDPAVSDTDRAAAEKAVLAAFPGGTLLDVEAGDDQGVAFEAEVRAADGAEWDVDLDASFAVLAKTAD